MITFNEKDDRIEVLTHNRKLIKKLTALNARHPDCCELICIDKEIGRYCFLLPGDPRFTVRLQDKLTRYETAACFSREDLQRLTILFTDSLPAPKGICWPLLAMVFLSPLNEFLHRANCEPIFVTMLLGRTGTRKSTLSALFLSFFGQFTASDLPLSFRDTAKCIV